MDLGKVRTLPTRYILVAIVLVIVLFFATLYYQTYTARQSAQNNVGPTPTPIRDSNGFIITPTANPYPALSKQQIAHNKLEESILKRQRVITYDELQKINKVKSTMPVITSDYQIGYSEYLNKFFIYKLNPDAQARVNAYFASQGLADVTSSFPSLFQYVNSPVQDAMQQAENDLFIKRENAHTQSQVQGISVQAQGAQNTTPSSDPWEPVVPNQNDTKSAVQYLFDIMKGTGNEKADPNLPGVLDNLENNSTGTGAGGTGGAGIPGQGQHVNATGSLAVIFNEVADKVGTPAKILQAVMRHECGRLLDPSITTDAQIVQWSTPGQGLPPDHFCFENGGGDQGPMQFNKYAGSFTTYGNAVNQYGGYTHSPYVENIRDAVYAAAEKLAEQSGGQRFGAWTEQQVKNAIIYYNYGNLTPPTPSSTLQYAQDVWDEYSSSN